MLTNLAPDATASTALPTDFSSAGSFSADFPKSDFSENSVRHMVFGTPKAVAKTVHNLHSRGYAEPNDWSPAISTGRPGEVMRILIRRLSTDS